MSNGYPGIITPYNTSQFEAIAEDIRNHFNANAASLITVGAELRRELPNAKNVSGRRGMLGQDLKLAAWQIARQFAQAAAAQTASAAAVSRAHSLYLGSFHSRNARGAVRGKFDAA